MAFYYPIAQGTATVSSGFGPRWGTHHNGLDFACPVGTPLYAPADGVVVQGKDRPQGSVSGFGSWIWLDAQVACGKDFIFGHVDHPRIVVRAGDRVVAGQLIGYSGNEGQSTGPHLHFEVWGRPGRSGGVVEDPAAWLKRVGAVYPGVGEREYEEVGTVASVPKITDISQKFGFGYARPVSQIQAVFIHTTENPATSRAIDVGNWQSGGKASGNTALGSYHVLADRSELVRCNTDGWVAYGTGNRGNQVGLQLSFVGRAAWSREVWLAEEKQYGTLSRGAWQVAQWCVKHKIPPVFVDGAGLRAGKRGVSTHDAARVAWGVTDHTDPGRGFPMDVFLSLVKGYMNPVAKVTVTKKEDAMDGAAELAKDNQIQLRGPGTQGWDINQLIVAAGKRSPNYDKGTLVELVAILIDEVRTMRAELASLKRT